jgi:hypothetical protein
MLSNQVTSTIIYIVLDPSKRVCADPVGRVAILEVEGPGPPVGVSERQLSPDRAQIDASTICIHSLMYVKPCREHILLRQYGTNTYILKNHTVSSFGISVSDLVWKHRRKKKLFQFFKDGVSYLNKILRKIIFCKF